MYTLNLAVIAATFIPITSAVALPALGSSVSPRDHGGFSFPMRKRASSTTSLGKRALTADIGDRWWITLGVGQNPQQALNFLPDTGSNTFSVGSTLLPPDEQGNGLYYNPNASSSARQLKGYTYAEYFSGYTDSGVVYNETFTISDQTLTSIPICVQTQASRPTENDRSGNLGLNRDYAGQSTSPTRLPSFMQAVKTRLPNWLFTTSFNLYTNTGVIDFGFIDTSKYTGTLGYAKATSSGQWYTNFNGLIIKGAQKAFTFQVLIDTGGGGATLPKDVLDAYFTQISGATFDSSQQTYTFPCNAALPPLTFLVAGIQLNVPAVSWVSGVIGSTGQCSSKITQSSDAGAYLGEGFIDGVFLVFDLANDRIGFANRPAISHTISAKPAQETIYLTQGPNGKGPTQSMAWASSACYSLRTTPVYNNVSAFHQTAGSCTLYTDTACASPIADATEIYNSLPSSGKTLSAGSFMCLNPNFYKPTGTGEMQYCTSPNFSSGCNTDQWASFVCKPLPSNYVNKVQSAGPYPGYCTWYTDNACAKPIQGDAVMPYPGENITPWGNQTGSYMCI